LEEKHKQYALLLRLTITLFFLILVSFVTTIAVNRVQGYGIHFIGLDTPAVFLEITLNYIGFVFPLAVSAGMAVMCCVQGKPSRAEAVGMPISFFAVMVVLLALRAPLEAKQYGYGLNPALLDLAEAWIVLLMGFGSPKTAVMLSYPMGFAAGALNDILVLTRIHTYSVFGGLGPLDGDFIAPLELLVGALLAFLIIKKLGLEAIR
jgi:hypothetical protein